MKFVWEAKDIKGGLVVKAPTAQERWMVVYDCKMPTANRYGLVSLSDGMIACVNVSAGHVASSLNAALNVPITLVE